MNKLICFWLAIFLGCAEAKADDFQINFVEFNPKEAYVYQVFINSNRYVRVKIKKEFDKELNLIVPKIQELYSTDSFSENLGKELVEKLIDFGVQRWNIKYPAHSHGKVQLCNGAHYDFYIKSDNLTKTVSGECYFPENYQNVIKLLMGER